MTRRESDIQRLERYERMAANVRAHPQVRVELERRCRRVRQAMREMEVKEGLR